jgi:acyl-coenzyme A thioesterase PaaI-like protein
MTHDDAAVLRDLVMQGLARNRRPGLHFPGHFMALDRRQFDRDAVVLALPTGPHIADAQGRIGLPAVSLLVDVTLATSMRPFLAPGVRTATVSMQIVFTGLDPVGELVCEAQCLGFSTEAALPQAVCRGVLKSSHGVVCYCSGTFVQLATPPGVTLAPTAWEVDTSGETPPIEGTPLSEAERQVLRHTDRVLRSLGPGECFVDRFWGGEVRPGEGKVRSRMAIGPHANNRVGNSQGGLMMAYAASTAAAVVPRHSVLESISAWFISPGVGTQLRAVGEPLQQGRSLAVVRTQVFAPGRKRVLEVITNHGSPKARAGA